MVDVRQQKVFVLGPVLGGQLVTEMLMSVFGRDFSFISNCPGNPCAHSIRQSLTVLSDKKLTIRKFFSGSERFQLVN